MLQVDQIKFNDSLAGNAKPCNQSKSGNSFNLKKTEGPQKNRQEQRQPKEHDELENKVGNRV